MKIYEIYFISVEYSLDSLKKKLKSLQIHFVRNRIVKQNNVVNEEYNIVVSPKENREIIDNFLINNTCINRF